MWNGIWLMRSPFTRSLNDKIPEQSCETREGQVNRPKVDKGGNYMLFSLSGISLNDLVYRYWRLHHAWPHEW